MRNVMTILAMAAGLALIGCAAKTTPPDKNTKTTPPGKTTPAGQATKTPAPVATKTPPPTTPAGNGKGLQLVAVKNGRILFHASESDFNGGGVHRLRASGLALDSADVAIIDFDRTALKTFLDKNKGKQVSAAMELSIRDLDKDQPGKLELAALDTGSDWIQGDKEAQQAGKGEPCNSAAAFGVKSWTTPDGKNVDNLRTLLFGTSKTLMNSAGVNVTSADKQKTVSIPLDAKFLEHLATDAACKGVVVFTRGNNARVSFSSRDKEGKEPRLVVTVK